MREITPNNFSRDQNLCLAVKWTSFSVSFSRICSNELRRITTLDFEYNFVTTFNGTLFWYTLDSFIMIGYDQVDDKWSLSKGLYTKSVAVTKSWTIPPLWKRDKRAPLKNPFAICRSSAICSTRSSWRQFDISSATIDSVCKFNETFKLNNADFFFLREVNFTKNLH